MSTQPTAPAGWYTNDGKAQWWDGNQWSDAQPTQKERDAANPYQKFLLGAAIVAVAAGILVALLANVQVHEATYYGDPTAAYGWVWGGLLLIVAGVVCFLMWVGARARR